MQIPQHHLEDSALGLLLCSLICSRHQAPCGFGAFPRDVTHAPLLFCLHLEFLHVLEASGPMPLPSFFMKHYLLSCPQSLSATVSSGLTLTLHLCVITLTTLKPNYMPTCRFAEPPCELLDVREYILLTFVFPAPGTISSIYDLLNEDLVDIVNKKSIP